MSVLLCLLLRWLYRLSYRYLHIVAVLMFVTFMLLVAIVYLNLLVAIMTSGYTEVRKAYRYFATQPLIVTRLEVQLAYFVIQLSRGALVIRTYDGPQNPYIPLFLHAILGPDYYSGYTTWKQCGIIFAAANEG